MGGACKWAVHINGRCIWVLGSTKSPDLMRLVLSAQIVQLGVLVCPCVHEPILHVLQDVVPVQHMLDVNLGLHQACGQHL